MSLSTGLQQANFASTVQQSLPSAPVIDGVTIFVPAPPGIAVLLAAQTDPKENGLYDVSKTGGVVTWTRRLLTAPDCQVEVSSLTGAGRWSIDGTPAYGTDNVNVHRV